MRHSMSLIWLALAAMAGAAAAASPSEKPNIILILADDFGYECIGADGGTSYATPHVDRLASTGMRFDRCYAQPLCTPTRAQIMTGLYNVRNYVRFGYLPPDQTTFAGLLKKAGYATCMTGKWQLANGFEGPAQFGFDEYGLWQLTRRPPRYANPGLEINGREHDYTGGQYGPDLVNQYALDFIARQKDRPFFLYYAMMLTHAPYQPTPDSPDWDPQAKGEAVGHDDKHFKEMVQYMDKLIGKLVARLDELGLRRRTLILFTGDNGTGRGLDSRMGDLVVHGGKGQMTEAGMHVPLVANWPGTIAPGRVSQDLVDMSDFLPTICDAAGGALPSDIPFDGRSFLPQLRGEKGRPREWIYCWYAPNQGRVDVPREFAASDRYKLFRDGAFYLVDAKRYEETRLDASRLDAEASAARQRLQAVLDQYQAARPKTLVAPPTTEDQPKPKRKAAKASRGT